MTQETATAPPPPATVERPLWEGVFGPLPSVSDDIPDSPYVLGMNDIAYVIFFLLLGPWPSSGRFVQLSVLGIILAFQLLEFAAIYPLRIGRPTWWLPFQTIVWLLKALLLRVAPITLHPHKIITPESVINLAISFTLLESLLFFFVDSESAVADQAQAPHFVLISFIWVFTLCFAFLSMYVIHPGRLLLAISGCDLRFPKIRFSKKSGKRNKYSQLSADVEGFEERPSLDV